MNLDILKRAPVKGDKVIAVNYDTDIPIITTVMKTEGSFIYMDPTPFGQYNYPFYEGIKRNIEHIIVISQQLEINKEEFPENFI